MGSQKMGGLGILGIVGAVHPTQFTQIMGLLVTILHKQKTDDIKSHLLNPIKACRDTGIRTALAEEPIPYKKSARRSLSNKSL